MMRPSSVKSSLCEHLDGPAQMVSQTFWRASNNMFYTYVLHCENLKTRANNFYIGSTSDLRNRLKEHKLGEVQTTKKFDRITLVYYEACMDKTDSRKRELQLKTGFGRGYLNKRIQNYLENNAGIV
ncbi:MAG: GIY-YIG nuclease family protein [Patescibacteria group bacterium]